MACFLSFPGGFFLIYIYHKSFPDLGHYPFFFLVCKGDSTKENSSRAGPRRTACITGPLEDKLQV